MSHTGFVSTEQLAKAIQDDPSIKGQEAEALALMYEIKPVQNTGKFLGPQFFNSSPITRAEIEDLPVSPAEEASKMQLVNDIHTHVLPGMDESKKGFRLSETAVTAALGAEAGKEYGQMAEDYATNNLTPAEQAEVCKKGLNQAELTGLVTDEALRVERASQLGNDLQFMDNDLNTSTERQAFANGQSSPDNIHSDDIKQGFAGDCYFDTAMYVVAKEEPETIANSIKQNQDGSYTVTFKGDPQHPVNVAPPTDAELALYNHGSPNGIWPNIMEKAFADHQVLFAHVNPQNETNQDAISEGYASDAYRLLTGKSIDYEPFSQGTALDPQPVSDGKAPLEQLESAVSEGKNVIVGTGIAADGSSLDSGHDYNVLGYTPGANGGSFQLRNPFDSSMVVNGGIVDVPAEDLAQTIQEMFIEPDRSNASAHGR